jgi:hypothetical protein
MRTFGLHRRSWWVVRGLGPNPLLRRTDRIEALVIVIAVVVAVAVIPVATTVGAAVYGSRAQLYNQEAQTRHSVAATVIQSDAGTSRPHSTTHAVRATWRAGSDERTGWFMTDDAVKVGDHLQIWVSNDGERVASPTPTSQADIDAVGVGAGMWCAVAFALTALVALTRSPLNRIRYAQWERELKSLADGGRPNRRRR